LNPPGLERPAQEDPIWHSIKGIDQPLFHSPFVVSLEEFVPHLPFEFSAILSRTKA
jgi:hypothetical protein